MVFYTNTHLQIISLFYVILIGIIFLVKKKVESAENSIFRDLVIAGFFSAIFDISSIVLAVNYPNSLITVLAEKGYLLCLIGFCVIYTNYAIIITNSETNNEQKLLEYRKLRKIILGIFLLCFIIIFIAPIKTFTEGINIMYTYGAATSITYIICGFCIVLWVALLIVRVKYLAPRKMLPILCVIIFGGFAMIIQFFFPDVLLVTSAMIFSIVIMYFSVFTIENPDLEMVEELKKARNEAIYASNAKSEFLSNMSHELRTPLNAILGFSQGLLEQDIDPKAKEDIEDIMSASDTLLELVNEILDISKIESDKLEIVNLDYSVNKVYKYLVTMTEGRIGSRQLGFIHEYHNNIPPVLYGDCVRIKQVIVNLLTNAVKYTKQGYVKLTLDFEKIDEESGYLVATVNDTGIGIKEDDIEKLFSKFSRLDIKKNIDIEGTGLGLALTKKLIDLMDGEIRVESKYGVGSTFTVRLKQKISSKKLEEVEQENPMISRGTFVGNNEKILVVDDNTVNLKVAERLLGHYQIKLETATSGRECIEKVQENNHYDLIMLDDQMPEMTGTETLENLKKIPSYHTPTIVLTANAISGMKEKYLENGFDDYLSKPIDVLMLEQVLQKFLGNKKQDDVEELLWEDEKEEQEERKEEKKENKNVGSREYLESCGLDVAKALETLIDMEMYQETAIDVLEDSDNKVKDLKKYLEEKDMKNYSVVAHALKGDARYMGMTTLADIAYQQELASRDGKIEEVTEHFDEFMKETEKMMSILRTFLGK